MLVDLDLAGAVDVVVEGAALTFLESMVVFEAFPSLVDGPVMVV